MNAVSSGLDKTKCTFSAIFAFDTHSNVRTDKNRCKTTDMSITYLDVTGAKSGLEPPFSQMSSMENEKRKYKMEKGKCYKTDARKLASPAVG